MSDSTLAPKKVSEPARPPESGRPFQDLLKQAPMLKVLFGKDQAWLLLLAALPTPFLAVWPNPFLFAWSVIVLLVWVLGKALKLFEY